MIKQIGLPLRGRPILLITRMITDRIGLHSVLLPLLVTAHNSYYITVILQKQSKTCSVFAWPDINI